MLQSFLPPQLAEFGYAFTETAFLVGRSGLYRQLGRRFCLGPQCCSLSGRHCCKQLIDLHGSDDRAKTCLWILVAYCGLSLKAFMATARTTEVEEPYGCLEKHI